MKHKSTDVALAGRNVTGVRSYTKWLAGVTSLSVESAWVVFVLISVIYSAACAKRTDPIVDGPEDAPLSRNGREVSTTTAATVPDGRATESTSDPVSDRAALRPTEDADEEAALSGTWIGMARQFSVDSSWSIEITFEGDGGDIRYPSLACGGQLQPVSRSDTQLVYRERIRFGLSQCIDNGRVVLERTSKDTLSYEWHDESGALDATGNLRLRTED